MGTPVSLAMSELFYEQCAGTTSGHMAMIPNSPILFGITAAQCGNPVGHNAASKEDFAAFLRDAADWLDGGGHA